MRDARIDNGFNKKDVLFITAETGYVKKGLENGGYAVLHPYRYKTVLGRIFLEFLIRIKAPQKGMFNKQILKSSRKFIIVQDSIITRQFLNWLKSHLPDSKIIFDYTNMVGKAHHILPNEIPEGIDVWTYDKHDSDKYDLNLFSSGGYLTSFIGEKCEKKYDIIYVGKDKGRAEYILELQKKFEEMGLTTKFLIMPSTRVSKKKRFYSKPIPYEEVIKLVTESRAILNIALPNQQGATMRDYESIFNDVKLITTNQIVNNFEFYDPNNMYILTNDNIEGVKDFMSLPYHPIKESILEKHTIDSFVKEIINHQTRCQ